MEWQNTLIPEFTTQFQEGVLAQQLQTEQHAKVALLPTANPAELSDLYRLGFAFSAYQWLRN